MRRAAPWILAAVLASGCFSPDAPPDPSVSASGMHPLMADLNVVIQPGGRGGEPMLGVAADGTFYSYATPPGTSYDAVYRSDDDGRTWQRVGPGPAEGAAGLGAGDPDLTVDPDGTVWFVSLVRGCNFAAASRDRGETWTVQERLCLGPSYDRPRIVPAVGGVAFLYHHNGRGSTAVLRTADHGQTWTPVASVQTWATEHSDVRLDWGSGGFWDPYTGAVHFTYPVTTGPDSPLLGPIMTSPGMGVIGADGAAFEVRTVPGVAWENGEEGLASNVVDGVVAVGGTIFLAWAEIREGQSDVRVAASKDGGQTWLDPFQVDPPGITAVFPTLAAGPSGGLVVGYYGTSALALPVAAPEDAEWNVTLAFARDPTGPGAIFDYGNLSHGAIHRGPLCTGLVCEAEGGDDRALLEYFDVQSLGDGRVAAVWANSVLEPDITAVNVFAVTREPLL